MKRKFYITSAIPYVNSLPHVGHALEFVQTDAIARYHKLLGEDVLMLSGGDENALKNVQAAEKAGEGVQGFVDKNTEKFLELTKKLNCQFDIWQKGSDQEHHFPSSQKLWKLCDKAGDIYKKTYEGLYCVGCEQFYLPSELNENGECFEHPGKKLETVSEENYFFKLSRYQKELIDLIESNKLKIIPVERKNEVLSFLKEPLQDISISRSNERAKNWGVPVPNDPGQKIYVWFDALQIYQTGVGFGWNEESYKKWWPADLHIIGKGITRFHAVYWPAFLLSAKLELPKAIFIHGYFTVNGQKMSKTLGNVINPVKLIEKYGADALRYYLLAKFSPFTDGDFSEEKLKDVYNGDLANGLGNLASRVAALCEKSGGGFPQDPAGYEIKHPVVESIERFRFDEALHALVSRYRSIDKEINGKEPWKLNPQTLIDTLKPWVEEIRNLSIELKPFLPETAEKIEKQFKGPEIKAEEPLFPRLR
jgi:methionyl-tRNA synthetase